MAAGHELTDAQVAIIRAAVAPFASRISRVCLFGSRAIGTARPNSDIDLVIYGLDDPASLDRIRTRLDASLLSVPVDVIGYALTDTPRSRRISMPLPGH